MNKHLPPSAQALHNSIATLRQVVSNRIRSYINNQPFTIDESLADEWNEQFHSLPAFAQLAPLTESEWLVLLLSLVPHVQPNFFESIIAQQLPSGGDFPEFGGVKATNHRGMLPTGETTQFIIAGDDFDLRASVQQLFSPAHLFAKQNILRLESLKDGEPKMSGRIILSQEWIDKILTGKETEPHFGVDFPAKKVTTEMDWDDVVLHPQTQQQVSDISTWLHHQTKFLDDDNLRRKLKPGYRVLFYGPPGTGKTLTAALIGKEFGKDVFRIDLSQLVSKYIGETEKNLEGIFSRAEHKDWILFFDEADALFGKRTNVKDAHDKYANQEVSYLLQRLEDYPGLLILASNFKSNLDEAFIRRFHAVVHFPLPNVSERLHLWEKTLPASLKADPSVNVRWLAEKYELSGASILNAVQFASLQAFKRNDGRLTQNDLLEGVRKEFLKEEKAM
jgi:AAA+ superfamily predicted ATPase